MSDSVASGAVAAVVEAARDFLGERITTSTGHRDHHSHGQDTQPPVLPDAVAFVESTEEVSRLLALCHQHGVPVVPFGAGTSLEGHVNPVRAGISLDLSRMTAVLEVNAADMDCRVQAGVTHRSLNTHLRDQGLFSRCLVAYPQSTAGTRMFRNEKADEAPAAAAYVSRMAALLGGTWPINEFHELQPQHMGIGGPARTLWIEIHDQIERGIGGREGGRIDVRGAHRSVGFDEVLGERKRGLLVRIVCNQIHGHSPNRRPGKLDPARCIEIVEVALTHNGQEAESAVAPHGAGHVERGAALSFR